MKINVKNIENYESMTDAEKVAALEAYETDMSGFVAKSVADKLASEAAEYKKKLREAMTDEEAKATKDAEEREALLKRVAELEHDKLVSEYTATYAAMGYDEKLAKSSAEALANGDMETVFKNQRTYADTREKALKTELLKQTPPPAAGNGTEGGMTKKEFAGLTLAEKAKFADENPEKYKEFYGGN